MNVLVTVSKLTKNFGPLTAVNEIDFQVHKGDVLGFLGPNGAGKSTTMKMITGFVAPSSGSVLIMGKNLQENHKFAKQNIGYLPEGAPAYSDMTPWQFLSFVADIRGFRGKAKQRHIDQAIEVIQLSDVIHQPIETLSKGFKRRVGLAQAILHDPAILVLDEPTDGLDPNQKHEVRNLIARMSSDKAIILSTHILEEVDAVCNRSIIIAGGKIVADGTPESLREQGPSDNSIVLGLVCDSDFDVQSFLAQQPFISELNVLKQDDHVVYFSIHGHPGQSLVDEIGLLSKKQHWQVHEMRPDRRRLDEVFRHLTIDEQTRT